MLALSEAGSNASRRVVFLLQRAFHPRYHRRIDAWLNHGLDVTVYYFQRGAADQPPEIPPGRGGAVSLGFATDRDYVRRIPQLFQAARRIRENERGADPPAHVYCFGWDMTALGISTFPGSRYVTEIGDIRLGQLRARPVLRSVVGLVERALTRRVVTLVLTSPGFIDAIPSARSTMTRALVHENRVPLRYADEWMSHRREVVPQTHDNLLRIGVIGVFRYPFTLLPFLDAVGACSDVPISVELFGRGELTPDVETYSERFENIRYHGPFQAPQDLPRIYRAVDIVFSVYDNRDYNVKLALPNKLYEAAFFGVPILVASDTSLASRVETWGIGWPVDPRRPGWAQDWLRNLTAEAVRVRRDAALALPLEELVSDEARLVRAIASR